MPTGPLTPLANLRGLTDENGALKVVAVTAGSGTSPLTPFANLRGTTDETGALRVGAITLNPPLGPPTDLANLRVCTDETGALLVASQTAGSLTSPPTNLGNLRARTDARGSLIVASGAAGSLSTAPTPLLNLRGRTDDQGALVVTGLTNPVAVYQARVLTDGAAAYWPLDDAAGSTFARDLAGPRNATINGGVTLNQSGVGSARAMAFDSTGYLTPPSWPLQGLSFSHEVWFYANATPAVRRMMLGRQLAGDGDFVLIHQAPGSTQVQLLFQQSGLQFVNFGTELPTGQWTHLVITYSGTVVLLYVNGVLAASDALLTGGTGGGAPSLGGWLSATTEGWRGALSDIAVYQRLLNATEIAAHYTLGIAR